MNNFKKLIILSTTAIAGFGHAATLGVDATAYALGREGTQLITVASGNDAAPSALNLDFGGDFVTLDAIAYRPMTQGLYGYDNESDTVFLIDTMTGMATAQAMQSGLTQSDDIGFDFNNVIDAARIVTAENENRVYFPNNADSPFLEATDLFIVEGDVNEGFDPNAVGNAYTNAVAGASSTIQYVIDSDWNSLMTLGNNAGNLETVGRITFEGETFDFTEDAGFDILSFFEGDNTAFALLTNGMTGEQGVYEIPLFADANGNVNIRFVTAAPTAFGTLDSFAVAPEFAAPVPLPASLPLLAGALGLAGWCTRRKRA